MTWRLKLNNRLDIVKLKNRLHYDPITGIWTEKHTGKIRGSLTGCEDYLTVFICGKNHRAHRLAWFYITGEWPKAEIDHKNKNGLDNRWCNLREADRAQNNQNKGCYKNNKLGIKGVRLHNNSYEARISFGKKTITIGIYKTPEEAKAAYDAAKLIHHGEYANKGD